MKLYYEKDGITIYHGDSREALAGAFRCFDCVITDPVWPNAVASLQGAENPLALFRDVAYFFPKITGRVVVQLGCDSDPRFLQAVPEELRFFRCCWLEYACPNYKGRLLLTSDMAYAFGDPPAAEPGRMVIPGKCISVESGSKKLLKHPCPRRLTHLRWLVKWFAAGEVLDPFAGTGTTLLAAKMQGRRAVGIEIEERFCETAAKRLEQRVLAFAEND